MAKGSDLGSKGGFKAAPVSGTIQGGRPGGGKVEPGKNGGVHQGVRPTPTKGSNSGPR